MTDSSYSLDRRQLLRTTAAGVAGSLCLTAPGSATTDRSATQEEAPDEDEYEAILEEMEGDGSEEAPYVVTDVVELQAANGDLEAFYELDADVDASATAEWNDGAGIDPIGSPNEPFLSELDGKGNEIRNVVVDRPDRGLVGLFGSMGGRIKNLHVEGTVTGDESVGIVLGQNTGVVRNVSAGGTVEGAKFVGGLVGGNRGQVHGSTATGTVTGENRVGGCFGRSVGKVTDTAADCEVSGAAFVGGFCGFNHATMQGVSAAGTVDGEVKIGGLSGENQGSITTATAEATVTGVDLVGGMIGQNRGPVSDSRTTADVTGTTQVGGVVGKNWAALETLAVEGSVSGEETVGGIAGWNTTGGVVTGSVVFGEVTGDAEVGSVVGRLGWEFQGEEATAGVQNAYWSSDHSKYDGVGTNAPGDGETVVEGIAGLPAAEMRGESASEAMSNLDFERNWRVVSDGLPALRAFTPPSFQVVDMTPQEVEIEQGNNFTISVTVQNDSEWDGTRDVTLLVEADPVLQKTVTLASGGQTTVEFELGAGELPANTYQFAVATGDDAQTGTLVVESAPNVDGGGDGGGDDGSDDGGGDDGSDDGGGDDGSDDGGGDDGGDDESADDDGPGFGIAGAVTGLGGAYLAARRLRGRGEE